MNEYDWRELDKLCTELRHLSEDGGQLDLDRDKAELLLRCVELVTALRFFMPKED